VSGKLLTAEQVAEITGMSKGWIWKQSREGNFPAVPLGTRRYGYIEESVWAWLKEQETGNGTATQSTLGSQDEKRGGTADTARPRSQGGTP
jgi:predicted DNA-binding transcriptional regulator AlpA